MLTSRTASSPCVRSSTESYCVALVCPSHAALKALGTSMGLGTDVATLCKSEKVIAEVQKQIHAVVKGKLVAFETPKRIGLVDEPGTELGTGRRATALL